MKNFFIDLGHGIKNVFKGPAINDNLFALDGRVPLRKAIPFGIQHVLAMFAANIVPIIIVFSSCGILASNPEFGTQAMLSALFMAGIGTMIQLFLGARLPIVVGTSFTFVGVFIAMTRGLAPEDAYYTIMGSILIGGIFIALFAFLYRFWGKIIKPIVPAVVVLSIGLSLLQSGATQFVGGSNVLNNIIGGTYTGVAFYWYPIVAIITMVVALFWQLLFKGVWKNVNIIVGILVGYLVACLIPGMVDFSSLAVTEAIGPHGVFTFPTFINLGKLQFRLVPIIMTCICFLVGAIEAIGDSSALAETGLGRRPTQREFTGLLLTDGLVSTVGCLFGSLPLTTFSQNVGIVSQTKVVNRFSIFMGAIFLVIAGFFPPIANFLYTIPDCVLGGTMVILFGNIAVVGMQMASEQGFSAKNIMILTLCLCLGFGLTLVGELQTVLSIYQLDNLAALLGNPTINMFVLAMILSWVLPDDMHISFKKKEA